MAAYFQHTFQRKSIRILWVSAAVALVLPLVFLWAIEINALHLFGPMPGMAKLENPKIAVPSYVFTSDGQLLGKYFRENRSPVEFSDLPPHLIEALLATEDIRYREHSGIDPEALGSVVYYSLKGKNRGGSTITQQLTKNLYRTRGEEEQGYLSSVSGLGTLIYKLKEWILSVKIERAYTKEEILTMYLNTVAFGSEAYGVKTAAKTYFSKSLDSLTVEEAATLVGLLKATTTYNPLIHPDRSRERRNVVLAQMAKYGYLSAAEADSLQALPLVVEPTLERVADGPSGYYRHALQQNLEAWCEENGYDLYTDGLMIYTTLDSRVQAHAEAAVKKRMSQLQGVFNEHWRGQNPWIDGRKREIPNFIEQAAQRTKTYKYLAESLKGDSVAIWRAMNEPHPMRIFTWNGEVDTTLSTLDSLRYYKKLLHTGFMAMDPYNGHIKAWVGGIDYGHFQYDHVQQAKRQPGSTFKPFVYAAALEEGYSPCDRFVDQPVTVRYLENGEKKAWSPRNADWVFSGRSMSLRWAMAKSVNSITAQLTEKIGWDTVADYARRMGIDSPLEEVPSIGLGSSDVSVYEMVGAYGTFVNGGVWTQPILLARIEDRHGNLIHEFVAPRRRAISEETAYLMTYMLRGTLEEPEGTAQGLWAYDVHRGNQIGGKTGTSSNYSDGWFISVTKDLIAGTWVGAEDRSVHFRTSSLGEGGKTALPLVGEFLEQVYDDDSLGYAFGKFNKPEAEIKKQYQCPTIIPEPIDIAIDSVVIEAKRVQPLPLGPTQAKAEPALPVVGGIRSIVQTEGNRAVRNQE
ncbi:penicillin-binding protein 1A [Catalinimonas alkaloidigena]|uniref:penicillin-binding protein 1A n=1 Tax=Catalinimonas alkaloidigena TaxID=1075417 RepID=UPI001FE12EF8|nr:transglycosylase domain-containing protein [Catalinimonas alkaloidigena]